jgi:hypothetical protein
VDIMERRTFLLASAATLAAAPALAAVPRLSDYVVLLGDRTGSAADTASGLGLVGGAFDDPGSGVRLFRKAKVGRTGRVQVPADADDRPGGHHERRRLVQRRPGLGAQPGHAGPVDRQQ